MAGKFANDPTDDSPAGAPRESALAISLFVVAGLAVLWLAVVAPTWWPAAAGSHHRATIRVRGLPIDGWSSGELADQYVEQLRSEVNTAVTTGNSVQVELCPDPSDAATHMLLLSYAGNSSEGPARLLRFAQQVARRKVPPSLLDECAALATEAARINRETQRTSAEFDNLSRQWQPLQSALRESRVAAESQKLSARTTDDAIPAERRAIGRQTAELLAARNELLIRVDAQREASRQLAGELAAAVERLQRWASAQMWVQHVVEPMGRPAPRPWTTGLVLALGMVSGSWGVAVWRRGNAPIGGAGDARRALGVPVLSIDRAPPGLAPAESTSPQLLH